MGTKPRAKPRPKRTKIHGNCWRHTFAVRGSGNFPIDMLRYDGCFPAYEIESRLIAMQADAGEDFFEQRTVTLCKVTERVWEPTTSRWRSYGWDVVDVPEPEL